MLAEKRRDALTERLAVLEARSVQSSEIAALKWALELADAEIFRLSLPTEGHVLRCERSGSSSTP
jgi:hypothetical protein